MFFYPIFYCPRIATIFVEFAAFSFTFVVSIPYFLTVSVLSMWGLDECQAYLYNEWLHIREPLCVFIVFLLLQVTQLEIKNINHKTLSYLIVYRCVFWEHVDVFTSSKTWVKTSICSGRFIERETSVAVLKWSIYSCLAIFKHQFVDISPDCSFVRGYSYKGSRLSEDIFMLNNVKSKCQFVEVGSYYWFALGVLCKGGRLSHLAASKCRISEAQLCLRFLSS